MNGRVAHDHSKPWLRTYFWLLIVSWTVVISASITWNLLNQNESMRAIVLSQARAYFNKDLAFRLWTTSHGGVYVPINEQTPPNPYLTHVPERDVETPSGTQLTLMNPSYAVRQMIEHFSELYGVSGHLTGLKPLRPQNAPDDWEQAALKAFNDGEKEVTEFTEIDGKPYLRLMGPVPTTEQCLKCHVNEGYQPGDVIGGVGVSIPMTPFLAVKQQQAAVVLLGHGGLWLLGLMGIGLGTRQVSQRLRAEQQAVLLESENRRMEDELSIGHRIQMGMLTTDFPVLEGLEVNATLKPAREVGGDLYDVFFVDQHHLCCYVGDVSGKGVPAALFMAISKTLIKAISTYQVTSYSGRSETAAPTANPQWSTATIMSSLNNELSRDNDETMFVTAFFCIVNMTTGKVFYTNAGHNPPYILGRDAQPITLDGLHGPMLGVTDQVTYGEGSIELAPGEQLLIYTDGVTEAFNAAGEMFTKRRLEHLVMGLPLSDAKSTVNSVLGNVMEFTGNAEQTDDITILTIQKKRQFSG